MLVLKNDDSIIIPCRMVDVLLKQTKMNRTNGKLKMYTVQK